MTPLAWFRWARRIVLALVLFVVAYVGYVWVHIWWVAREDQHPHSDAIVVLGASQYNGRPSPVFEARLDHALVLYNEGVATHIVTVGGKQPGDAYTEAQAGATYLRRHGVPKSALVALPTGNDTLRSLRAVDTAFKTHAWHTAVLVTDPWHCLRARTMARDLGIKAYTSPERTGPAVDGRGVEFRYIARETEAYIYYQIFGNDNEHSAGVI
ncbi:MAG TPA: YdcF family protein [Mycobacteriales bacterium]|nr:YdcF family protein [Mycobacteriales bacterium]